MPDFLTPTTELEAINAILASVGESPVDAVDGTFVDASLAKSMLDQESRGVQTQGWTFNEEIDVVLTPTVTGEIFVPQNTLRFLLAGDNTIVQRGFRLYDRANHSYTGFTASVTATLIVGLLFEELPEALRLFLTLRAGRRFQDRLQSDQILHEIQIKDELRAWADFQNFEAEAGQYNVLTNLPLLQRLKGGRA